MFLKTGLLNEVHKGKIIYFPSDLYEDKSVVPYAEKVFLSIVEAAMLFPKNYDEFAGYVAFRIESILTELESAQDNDDTNLDGVIAFLTEPFFGSFSSYCTHLKWKGFNKKGKGSLTEKVAQGRVCGCIAHCILCENMILKDAIYKTISVIDEFKNDQEIYSIFPAMSFENIQNSIWPQYKAVSWLWAASVCHDIPCKENYMELSNAMCVSPLFENKEPLLGGWRGFLAYAMNFYKKLNKREGHANYNNNYWPLKFGTFIDELPLKYVDLLLYRKNV